MRYPEGPRTSLLIYTFLRTDFYLEILFSFKGVVKYDFTFLTLVSV